VQITVVGAGVIGLTTALVLEEHGHDVRIVAASTGDATTSAVAGAVWLPYRVGPPDKVTAWGVRTRAWLESLAGDPDAGVARITGYEILPDGPRPWWAEGIDLDRAPAPVTGAPLAWRFATVRAEPARFLAWLTRRLRARVEHRIVGELADEPGELVVNCSGLAARELARDESIYPLLGQTVITDVGGVDRSLYVSDDRDPERMFYLIPRSDELVLGGCALPLPPGAPAEARPEITERILAHARSLGLPIGDVRRVRVGLRPYRLTVRLERAGRIIHNYGHGGAGFTLCRGCADDVYNLITPPK
jgi:D-amino-acid oxidase